MLVVEDNVEVGAFSTQILQDLGYETVWAANADEALKVLSEANGSGGFDVVFSDVVMPGMSGVELGEEIRRRHPGLPVVLTSGYSHVLAEEGRHGFELLHKPYAVEEPLAHCAARARKRDELSPGIRRLLCRGLERASHCQEIEVAHRYPIFRPGCPVSPSR